MRLRMIPVIFKEGIIASLTGGFYFDTSQTHFSNIVHVYVWIVLFVAPLVLFMISEESHIIAAIYSVSVGSFVLVVKLIIWRLHDLLDKSEPVVNNNQEANNSYANTEFSTQHQVNVHESDQEEFSDANEIESRCRRIGQAGIELAGLTDAISNHGSVSPLPDNEIVVSDTNQNAYTAKKDEIFKFEQFENNLEPSLEFSDNFTDHVTFSVPSTNAKESVIINDQDAVENVDCTSNTQSSLPTDLSVVNKGQIVDNQIGQLSLDGAPSSKEQKRIEFGRSISSRTARPIYLNGPLKRSFIGRNGRRAPVRRQFSETTVKNTNEIQRLCTFYDQTGHIPGLKCDQIVPETVNSSMEKIPSDKYPCSSISSSGRSLVRSSSVRTEIEHCKRIINQLKWDVSRLPPIPVTRFTPSVKDLETLNLDPGTSSTPSSFHTRSRSQLHRRALLVDWDQHKRTVAYLTRTGRNSIPYSTEFSLSETIFFWRQCFGNINHNRPTTSNSRRQQSNMLAFSDFSTGNLSLRHQRLPRGWRSHSLRYDPVAMNSITPYLRQLVRRPGTALRLQRQQSAGASYSPVTDSMSLHFRTSEMNNVQSSRGDSHVSLGSEITDVVILEGQEGSKVVDMSDGAEIHKEKWYIPEETYSALPNSDLKEEGGECLENNEKDANTTMITTTTNNNDGSKDSAVPTSLVDSISTDNIQSSCKQISHPLGLTNHDDGSSSSIPAEHNKLPITEIRNSYRLTRQAGFRRRPAVSPRPCSQSKTVSLHQSENDSCSSDSPLRNEDTKEISKKEIDNNCAQTSSSASKSTSLNPISVDQAVDNLLAHLMGVKSLAETGLTRQQCLLQLRGDGNAEDSENAEWDILYAVTEAATDSATVLQESTVANGETVNRDTRQINSSGNADSNSWDIQGLNITTYSSANRNRQSDDEINVQENPPNLSNDSGSDDEDRSSPNSLLWFFRKGFKPLRLQSQRLSPTAPVHTISLSPCLPFTLRLQLNRLQLGSVFDKSFTMLETILCSILAALVSIVGYYTLRTLSFQDYGPLACFTIAGCHYSLIKSVQPDPASPRHGYNRVIVFTRSVFFCFLASIYLLSNYLCQSPKSVLTTTTTGQASSLEHTGELRFESTLSFQSASQMLPSSVSETSEFSVEKMIWRMPNMYISQSTKTSDSPTIKFYGIDLSLKRFSYLVQCASAYVILIFPILFCCGLMPQINTVLIYALEQLDIHIFGASGTTGLFSVTFSILRTFIVLGITFIPCYYAIQQTSPESVLFSVFWGAEIALCFLLSRLPSNIMLYGTLLPSADRRVYYLNRIRICFYNAWYTLTTRPNWLSRTRRRWSKKKKSQVAPIDKQPIWWRRLPLLFPNLHMKSTNAMIRHNDDSNAAEEFLLTRLTHATGVVDVESGVPAHSHSLPSRMISRDCLTQSSSTPAIKYSLPHVDSNVKQLETTTTGLSTWINSKENENDDRKKSTTLDNLNNRPTNTLPSVVCQKTLVNSDSGSSIPPVCRDNSRVNTQQDHQTTSSLLSDQHLIQTHLQNGDPLPNLIRASLIARFENDILSSITWFALAFLVHFTSCFGYTYFQSYQYRILIWISVVLGFLLHYIWPNFRKPYPWLLLVKPIIKPDNQGKLLRWEIAYFWLCWLERNLFLPAITMFSVTYSFTSLITKFGPLMSTFIIIVTSMKMLRNGFCCAKQTYLSLFLTDLLFSYDFYNIKEAFPINYFFVSILVSKFIELFRKLHFIYVYLAPFNIIWGSVAHAVVQLGSIPHSVFMFANCIFSTVLSAPLEPLMASAIFITSYVRPISFWETNHRSQRIETTNMPIAAQLKGISKHQVSGNLDGIFYEHLTRKLQRILAGDLQLGRLGGLSINHGDVFILSTDDLNLLIHIIEVGNGFVTYQLRGLEFIGTLCHASESETLRSDPHKNKRFCCCHSKPPRGILSFNAAVRLRCMAWQFAYSPYIIEGYEVTDHSAGFTFQLTDLRKVLISRFVHCVIYFVCKLPNLSNRLTQLSACLEANRFSSPDYFDLDPVFFKMIDDDFDEDVNGVTRQRFVHIYSDWIAYCLKKNSENSSIPCGPESAVVSLCLALSLLGRRCMGGHQSSKHILDQFLHGVHQVFSGDINLAPRDDWVLTDLDLLQTVVTPSVRIALKLYQDTFTWSSGNAHHELYRKIVYTERNVVICQETDPKWRFAVLNDADCLFSFRWVSGRTSMDVYRIVQLTKRRLEFRAIKLNPECVRGLWAGQQREQIFLRNNNEERGSIQSANPVLRNLVNSSCDPPIGYPIYVSPLITSFAGDNEDYIRVCGGELSLVGILLRIRDCWSRFLRLYCCTGDESSGDKVGSNINVSSSMHNTEQQQQQQHTKFGFPTIGWVGTSSKLTLPSYPSTSTSKYSSRHSEGNRQTTLIALIHQQNDIDNMTGAGTSSTSTLRDGRNIESFCLEQMISRKRQKVKIIDTSQILNEHLNKLSWPYKEWCIQV
uniref:Pecanex-like protein n=1 Tax=Trichobilharzia regenti TaxID=157069 RepID=A0AA85KAK1_TRIRE|nr:unnamed protein product [Trichobilharzia regenti]